MFIFKKNYFLIIENTKDINLNNIKKNDKFILIYRNNNSESLNTLRHFRKLCRLKLIKFYIANNHKLAVLLRADGLYLSAKNRSFSPYSSFLGVVKFNIVYNISKKIIPLGGINLKTLNKIKNIRSDGLAVMTEIKKKPVKLINRLF